MSNGKFAVEFERQALKELEGIEKERRLRILEEIEKYLSTTPYQSIKTRIKRMTGFDPPLYRLRVGDYRVYYRIKTRRVVILGVLDKKDTRRWLR